MEGWWQFRWLHVHRACPPVRVWTAGVQALELLIRGPDVTPRERELLKAVPEMEVINAMVGNVKLAMPGLVKLKTQERRNRKKGKG